jgi:hypothetical protein
MTPIAAKTGAAPATPLRHGPWRGAVLVASLVVCGAFAATARAQVEPTAPVTPGAEQPPPPPPPPVARRGLSIPLAPDTRPPAADAGRRTIYHGMKSNTKAHAYYLATWGIDRLRVSYTMSGNLIRFNFRVVNPKLAKVLGDHDSTAEMFAPRSHAILSVPAMEQVGQLRQLRADKAGEEYWMVFSNKGNLVRPGDRVNVIIGKFHADGLVVE